ncbi:hypothetical protein COW36_23445 [bacterium (Candidatus Blackallbacteria) CG17_big_fil_post_rev_8_21_14_2_50_48_46]|uniref:Uncharacterized protein n=1 Tax=bacterium (Candidatus Blackallbacteria) CG17_big_fil_post_rev_8_21_14_2_50_48_46 TaxID=2014261 RepID=A0A2M7FXL1_9BACT|nr:MAG: hypothetical protein COW64_17655 [bacterium (Candidatus Blackallbacteria) CG18_big_fil_WC_8_21_14_2_50_49_26]PIW13998.1 MAG: hypothetical protein COW36_23445 [bacterium (Candidatus Blackallbacteria) CG17_big_fil_post_rev_8_21_14_2_50_48_46]PIW46848.1 MAG: hypothetical protein COW20_14620 [bacterium (Candidatus Blackallbacteria) CG13_big_fil_rev_8_21_14_2_50_49_14]
MSFSREAIHESQKKNTKQLSAPKGETPEKPSTAQLPAPPPLPGIPSASQSKIAPPPIATPAATTAASPPKPSATTAKASAGKRNSQSPNHLDHYVSEMNQEINRVSDVVGNSLDSLGDRISDAFRRLFEPIAQTLMGLAEAFAQTLHKLTVGLVKAILQEFTFVLRTLTDKILGGKRVAQAPTFTEPARGTAQLSAVAEEDDSKIPSFRSGFGTLVELRVFFSTIHNRPFLTEKDIRDFRPGNKRLEYEWMTRAIEEIRNCAPYGQKLPAPPKGTYMGIPMQDVLRNITYSDLESFLVFVSNRPQPFQQKPLKLSEAYATWAHKGAPDH